MQIEVINDIDQFEHLKPDWEQVYASDPDTTIFVSWGWIRGWIDTKSCEWSVLAARPDPSSPYVAFIPLGMESNQKNTFRRLFLGAAGHPGADSTGFVCMPGYIERAIPAFAGFIEERLKWDLFELRGVFDSRLDILLRYFSERKYCVEEHRSHSCPYIILPASWDEYLRDFLGSNTREKLKYYTRKLDKLAGFHVTQVRNDDLETQVNILLTLWQARFGRKPEFVLDRYRAIFRRCFENDCLWLTFFWDGSTPIMGKAAFLDYKKRSISSFTVAFNHEYAGFRPGTVMAGYAIRFAIENGFRIFDFGQGSEDYKFRFGAIERFHRNVSISPKTFFSTLKKRVPVSVKRILKMPLQKRDFKRLLIK